MLREAFKFTLLGGDPQIVHVEITDPHGVSWREAKKHLRQWYLERASELRSITQTKYFDQGQG